MSGPPRVGVVGHVEWVDFAPVPALPAPGAIVHAPGHFALPGGGGGVAAVQLARLAGACTFLTAVGDDALGARAADELRALGVDVHAAVRPRPQRRAFTHLTDDHERTITILGDRLVPRGSDPLPWDAIAGLDAVYFTGGDPGALRAARAARVLVATPRAMETILAAGVELDVLVASAVDPGERIEAEAIRPAPRHVVLTRGGEGGTWEGGDGRGTWEAAPLPGPPADSYGCGDTFAAALALGLGAGRPMRDAIAFAAACGAAVLTGRGPYGSALPQL